MNEDEFRSALHGVMTLTAQPEAMDGDRVLVAAQRVRRRRRNVMAGAGAMTAVAAVATTAVLLPGGSSGPRVQPGGPQGSTTTTTVPPSDQQTKPEWPDGQTDRTAHKGVRFEQGSALLNVLTEVRPDGYGAPTDLTMTFYDGPGELTIPLRDHQASFDDYVGDLEVWEYFANVPVTKDGGTGKLHALVHTSGWPAPTDPCALAQSSWEPDGECRVVAVDGKQVGVVTKTRDTDESQLDQWAAYRHADGTVVLVGQAKEYDTRGATASEPLRPLDGLPFTEEDLAELATSEQFELD